jgi:hypothetical protein
MALRLGHCRVMLVHRFDDPLRTSQWIETEAALEVSLAAASEEGHDVAMELLVCLGQALWEKVSGLERTTYWKLLDVENRQGVSGEIDEQALEARQALLENSANARNPARLEQYGQASFAATAAEYVHCLWHDVTIRTGPEHLPAPELRRRLRLFARWFPPDRGHRLFAADAGRRSAGGR